MDHSVYDMYVFSTNTAVVYALMANLWLSQARWQSPVRLQVPVAVRRASTDVGDISASQRLCFLYRHLHPHLLSSSTAAAAADVRLLIHPKPRTLIFYKQH